MTYKKELKELREENKRLHNLLERTWNLIIGDCQETNQVPNGAKQTTGLSPDTNSIKKELDKDYAKDENKEIEKRLKG